MGGGASVSSSVQEELPFDPKAFPRLGVRLSFLSLFLLDCGGREQLAGLTTTEVCERYVKPVTAVTQSSYVELLRHCKHEAVAEAQVFISHAWKYTFLDVADALLEHFQGEDSDIVIWFDLFSNNQHKAVDLDFDYWANTFQEAIKEFGRTVMVFAPWNNPVPLTRAWCLWELYCTVLTNAKFEVAMTVSAKQQFLEDVSSSADLQIKTMLATVDVEKSESFKPEDRDRIHHIVRKTVGFSALNSLTFERLRSWVIEQMEAETEKVREPARRGKVLHSLSVLYQGQGKYDKAEEFHVKCLDFHREVFGERFPATITVLGALAVLYQSQGKYDLAAPLYERCLELHKEVLGLDHPSTLWCMGSLASLYDSTGKYEQAEPLYTAAFQRQQETLGGKNPNTMWLMNSLAILYDRLEKYDLAEPLYKQCLESRKELLGFRHPDTLESMNCLATLFVRQQRYAEAELMANECYKLHQEVLGSKHPNTLRAMSNLAILYFGCDKYELAEPLYAECLAMQREVMGERHPYTLWLLGSLGSVYDRQGKLVEAEASYRECLRYQRELYGSNSPETVGTLKQLEALLERQQKQEQLEVLRKDFAS